MATCENLCVTRASFCDMRRGGMRRLWPQPRPLRAQEPFSDMRRYAQTHGLLAKMKALNATPLSLYLFWRYAPVYAPCIYIYMAFRQFFKRICAAICAVGFFL